MSQVAFDTLKYTHELEEAGVERKQAEAQVRVISEVVSEYAEKAKDELATKQDISSLRNDMSNLELRLSRSLMRNMLTGVSLITAVMVLLHYIVK